MPNNDAEHENAIKQRIGTAAFAFRGYNITNFGKTPELLDHPAFGPTVEAYLREASEICASVIKRPINLVQHARDRKESSLGTYGRDIALIVAIELAHLRLLEEFFGVAFNEAELAFGYSLGEPAALVAAGVYDMESVLTPLLALASDMAALARNTRLGILFSRGPALDFDAVERLCLDISHTGRGTIDISSFLSPNTCLLIGQGDTIDRFRVRMGDVLPERTNLRINQHVWPPIHTRITRQKSISNRAAVLMETVEGGFTAPSVPILSCVTGDMSYDDHNSREILYRWVDHPQRLWDVIAKTLARGVETIIHVGPGPNIVPATFERLANNITVQLSGRSLSHIGLRAISRIVRRRRPWLTNLLSSDTTLLRAPFVQHFHLEEWLLEQTVT
jgi:[acyl-carrier-protein] S-malonyltransferase